MLGRKKPLNDVLAEQVCRSRFWPKLLRVEFNNVAASMTTESRSLLSFLRWVHGDFIFIRPISDLCSPDQLTTLSVRFQIKNEQVRCRVQIGFVPYLYPMVTP